VCLLAGINISSAEPSQYPARMLSYGVKEFFGFSSVKGMKGMSQDILL
jgi:hypothetical protein